MAKPQYGHAHQKLRKDWQARIDAGEEVHCHHLPRCVEEDTRIHPGSKWDLGHVPRSTEYTGPEHRRCNRGTSRYEPEQETYGWFT